MPRPGATPVIRSGEDAEHGSSAELARTQASLPRGQSGQPEPARVRGPAQAASVPGGTLPADEMAGDENDGYDEALFTPTDRPSEPLTFGANFGPGANFVQRPFEDSRSFSLRVADEIESAGTPSLQGFVEAIRQGR